MKGPYCLAGLMNLAKRYGELDTQIAEMEQLRDLDGHLCTSATLCSKNIPMPVIGDTDYLSD